MIIRLLIMTAMVASTLATIICSTRKIPSAVWVKNFSIASLAFILATGIYIWSFTGKPILTYDLFGSLLMWLLMHALVGVILVFRRTTAATLSIYFGIQSTLAILLLISTFESTKADSTLNLLQNHMIAVYPPIIMLGCALLAVPLSMSLGNLLKEPASLRFLGAAHRWTLVSWILLSTGLFIGIYWSYSFLGDTQNNLKFAILSPIVPCLICAFLMHLMNLSKFKSAFVPPTYALTIFAYSSVLCGTFLVRLYISGSLSMRSTDNIIIIIAISIVNVVLLIGGFTLLTKKSQFLPKDYETEPLNMSAGGIIAHIGVLIGLIAFGLSATSETVILEMKAGRTIEAFEHKIIYEGQVYLDESNKNYVYTVDGETIRSLTKLKPNGEDALCEPAILRKFTGDIYITPMSSKSMEVKELILQHDQFTMDEELGYLYQKVEYVMNEIDEPIGIRVTITITDGDSVKTVEPVQLFTASASDSESFFDRRLRLIGISDDESNVRIEILPSIDKLASMPATASVSIKPFMWLLWLSFILIIAGISVTFINYF